MKVLAKEKAVKSDIIYNERFNCIDFNVYPNYWMADRWLEDADWKKTFDKNDRSSHHGLDYYYPLKDDKVSTIYRTYSHLNLWKSSLALLQHQTLTWHNNPTFFVKK